MKPITALLLLSLAGVGAACSDTVSGSSAEVAPAEVSAEATPASEVQGTLNLNIGRTAETPGRPIVGTDTGSGNGGLIVAPSSGGNFEDVEDLGIQIEDAPSEMLEPGAKSDEDELIRIPEKK